MLASQNLWVISTAGVLGKNSIRLKTVPTASFVVQSDLQISIGKALCWPNNTSVLVSAVMGVESPVAGRAGSGESVEAATQSSGYHHRPMA
jgi:hypothetical protein